MSAPASARLRRVRVLLGCAGLAMLIVLGLVLRGALATSLREQRLRREALAARVFDELEGSLAALIAVEQGRPFVQWRREWVPVGAGSGAAPSRSPLAELPEREFVVGYFQIEPDGSFASPLLPDPDQPEAGEAVRERVELLRTLAEDLERDEDSRLAAARLEQAPAANQAIPHQQVQQQAQVPDDIQIQRALDQQSIARQRKNATANQDRFAPDREQLSNFLGAVAPAIDPEGQDALDLRVTNFVGEPAEQGTIRLLRTVEIGGESWVQGVILEREALQRWLEAEVLGSPELAGYVDLSWFFGEEAPAPEPEAGRYIHSFAPPFSGLIVSAKLDPPSALASSGAKVVLALTIGLALALITVLLAVERSFAGLFERAEERERFVAAVTHELRTPLTSIRMYSEMLEQGMVQSSERQRNYHQTIRSEAERLSRLVEQVLSLARLEGREHDRVGEGERASVEEIVADALALLQPQARAKSIDLRSEIDPAVAEAQLVRDPCLQVLTNLLDNAIKFTPAEGGAVELEVGRGAERRVRVAIRDRGPGVEAEVLPTIFEPFVRGRREHEQAARGTGIGLAVVRSLIEELGGTIEGHNRPEGGFELIFELPRRAPPQKVKISTRA